MVARKGWAEGGRGTTFLGEAITVAEAAVMAAVVVTEGRTPPPISKASTATALIPSVASIEASTAIIKGTGAAGAGEAAAGGGARLIATKGRPGFRSGTAEGGSVAVAAAAMEDLGRAPALPVPARGAEDKGPAKNNS